MKHLLKKIVTFVFLLAGFMPVLFTLLFLFKQQLIRHEMKEKLETSLLQTITINEKDVVWMDNHEIWVNEHMFDIHIKKLENGVYTFTGLYDEQETNLVKKHKDTTEKNNEENQVLSSLFQLLESAFIEDEANSPITALIVTEYSPLILLHISTPSKNILTPPPQQPLTNS
jgi:hypothetical protein